MCWSFQVSIAFSVVEAVLAMASFVRSRLSKEYYVRQQWRLLPTLISVMGVEVIEAFLWAKPEELVPVSQAMTHTCSPRNQKLTLAIWLLIMPWQPFFGVMPCRRVLPRSNDALLQIVEVLAFFFGVSFFFAYVLAQYFPGSPLLSRSSLADHDYIGYHHTPSIAVGYPSDSTYLRENLTIGIYFTDNVPRPSIRSMCKKLKAKENHN